MTRSTRAGTSTAALRQLNAGAAVLAFSALADSALEHYRGGFLPRRDAIFGLVALVGLVGFGFHLRNTAKRERGWSWHNCFTERATAAAGLLGIAFRARAYAQHGRLAELEPEPSVGPRAGAAIAPGRAGATKA